jgi:hypothetical protein
MIFYASRFTNLVGSGGNPGFESIINTCQLLYFVRLKVSAIIARVSLMIG